jgi:hypothetical protein
MYYVLIHGGSYRNQPFEAREQIREELRHQLEKQGICFREYCWVWDEQDRCLLLVGQYGDLGNAHWWIRAFQTMGFDITIREQLPGDAGH